MQPKFSPAINPFQDTVSSAALRLYERKSEELLRQKNLLYGKVVEKQRNYIEKFKGELAQLVGAKFKVNGSSCWLTLYHSFHNTEAASVNLTENRIHIRYPGEVSVSKVIKTNRELTPQRVKAYMDKYFK